MSTPEKRRRIGTNAVLSGSTWLLPMVLSFVATPILLASLGHDAYGLYALVLGFIGYSFTFGIGKTAAKYVAEHRASGDDGLAAEAVSASLWFSLAIGTVGAILIIIFAGPFVDGVLHIPFGLSAEGKRAMFVAAGVIFATMLSQVWSFVLQGLHRFDRYAAITGIGSIVLNAGSVALALRGDGVVAILIWNLFSTCLLAVLFFASAKRAAPNIRLTTRIRPSVRNAVLRYGGAIILTQVFGNILLLVERSWIARNLGVEALTYYVVPMTLALFLHAFVGSVVIVLFPVVNESLDDEPRVSRLYRSSTKLVLAISAFAVVTSVSLGGEILTAWVGEDIATRSAPLLAVHMSTFGLLAAATVAWHVVESFGHARANVFFSLCWLIVGTALMFLLGGRYGLEGVAAARFIGCLGVIPLMLFVEWRVLKSFSVGFWLASILRLSLAAVAAGALQWLVQNWLHGLVAALCGIVVGGAFFAALLVAARYFEADELNWFRRFLRPSKS